MNLSPRPSLTSSTCSKPPLLPPSYTPHADDEVIGGPPPPLDYYNRSNYAVICRYAAGGPTPFPIVTVPAPGCDGNRGGFPIDSTTPLVAVAGRVIMPSAPDLDDDDNDRDDDVTTIASGGSDVTGRHYAAVMPWPPVGPYCTRVVHPPPVYTRYATTPTTAAATAPDSGEPTPHPTSAPVHSAPANVAKGPDFV
jgi:hypothetical protein